MAAIKCRIKKDDKVKVKELDEQMKSLNEEVMNEMQRVIDENKDNFLSKLLLASKDIKIPDPPKDENGNITDSLFQFRYYTKHYFDYIDFSDKRLLRTPFIESKIKKYFSALPWNLCQLGNCCQTASVTKGIKG